MSGRKIAMIFAVLSILLLLTASFNSSFESPDPGYLRLESKLLYVIISSVALGALLMFLIMTLLPSSVSPPGNFPAKAREKNQDLLALANAAVQLGDTEKARQVLEEMKQEDPGSNDVKRLEGDLEWHLQNRDAAEQRYLSSMESCNTPQKLQSLFRLTQLYEDLDQVDHARIFHREILRLMPSSLHAVESLRSFAIGSQDWEEAFVWQEYFERHHDRRLSLPEERMFQAGIRCELARLQFDHGSWNAAQALVKYVMRIADDFVPAYLLAGEIQQRNDNGAGAVKIWERGLRSTKHPILLRTIGEYFLSQNLTQKAIEFFRQAIKSWEEEYFLEYCLGDLFYRLEMHPEAIQVFERIRKSAPNWIVNQVMLGQVYRKTGRITEALQAFQYIMEASEVQPILAWQCEHCNTTYPEFRSFCQECLGWNRISLNRNQAGYDFSYEKSAAARP